MPEYQSDKIGFTWTDYIAGLWSLTVHTISQCRTFVTDRACRGTMQDLGY